MKYIAAALCLSVLILGGCAGTSAPSKFYLLNSIDGAGTEQKIEGPGAVSIGIGPIKFPQYLDRPQIVTRMGRNELKLGEFHRWGEPLKDNFSRVLMENLSKLLSTNRVFILPWGTSIPVDYRIMIDVARFDSEMDGKSILNARWVVFSLKDDKVVELRASSFQESASGNTYEARVEAMSKTMADLSREMADVIKEASR
jgi:uncharacterized protein